MSTTLLGSGKCKGASGSSTLFGSASQRSASCDYQQQQHPSSNKRYSISQDQGNDNMGDLLNEERKPIFQNSNDVNRSKLRQWIDGIPSRYVFSVLGFFGMMNVYAMRVNLSVAMVAMVNNTGSSGSGSSSECRNPHSTNSTNTINGEFNWDERTQGIILGSFFWGYIVTQLPGGRIAERFSGKWLYGVGVLCTAVFTLLTPLAARAGTGYLITARILEGLGEGVTFPAMHVMLSRWCLPYERSKLSTFVYTGAQVGTVIAMPITGILCETNDNRGWPNVFYFFGCCGVIWFLFWAFFAYDSPVKHPRISEEEKSYFVETLGIHGYNQTSMKDLFPWKHVFFSSAVWAIVVAHFGQNWGFYMLLTEMPTYMKNILHYDVKKNSFLSALPYLGMWIFGLMCSFLADHLRSTGIATTTTVRKVANFVGVVGPAAGLIGITLIGCSEVWNLFFLVLAVTLNGAVYAGFQCNHIDIAPKFAGTLIGISNSVATIPGIAAPYVVGILTENQQTLHQWYIIFYIAAAIYTFVGLFFVVFSSGEEQLWYKQTTDDEERFLTDPGALHSDKDE